MQTNIITPRTFRGLSLRNATLVLAALAFCQPAVHAAPVTVSNPSFESGNFTSWSGATGQWGVPSGTADNLIPTGTYMVYANGPATISQTLTDTLQPNTLYTLSVDVGRRNGFTQKAYTISLSAGATQIASTSGAQNSLSNGWHTITATYTSPGSVTTGQALKIKITGDGQQTWFDNVQLDATAIEVPPLAPTNLAATAGDSQVALTWTASSLATGYNVKRSTTSGSGYATIGTPSGTSYTDSSAVNTTTYYYVVSATNAVGEGANSTEVSATPTLPPPPAAPSGLAATAGNQQISVSWTASSGATGYTVQRSTTSGSGYATIGTPSGTSYTETGLTNGLTYYYVVAASNGGGTSAISSEVSASPSSTLVTIGDPSFEIGGSSQGDGKSIVSPWSTGNSWGYVDGTVAVGGLTATNGAWYVYCNANSQISQTLADTLQPNTTYTLSVDVGRRSDLGMPGYSISLYAGSTLQASTSGAGNSFPAGWTTVVATYTTLSSVTAGQALKIVLGGSGVQTEFDNVRLTAVTGGGASTYASWAADPAHGLTNPTNPAHVGNDGLTNLLVYALELKTDGSNGSPGTLAGNQLSFAKRADAVTNNDITYAIEISADLGVSSPWTTTTTGVTETTSAISIDLSTLAGSKHFARLVVTQK